MLRLGSVNKGLAEKHKAYCLDMQHQHKIQLCLFYLQRQHKDQHGNRWTLGPC